jgi:hypothetical protein
MTGTQAVSHEIGIGATASLLIRCYHSLLHQLAIIDRGYGLVV